MIGVAVVMALLGAIVIVGPSFIDSNALKREITTQARAATGRELTIGGNLEIRFFPAPALTANNVSLSNAADADNAEMVSLKAVEVRVALMPLLSGQVQVERIRLLSPVINIEKFADGRTNLEFKPETGATPSAEAPQSAPVARDGAQTKQGGGLDVRLDNFEVSGGQLIYRDAATGSVERIEDIDATLRAGSLNGPFEAQGQARVRGVPLAFEVSLGQIIEQRTVPVNAIVNAPGGARVQVTGAVLGLEAEPYFKGKVSASGKNLAQLVDALSAVGTAPALLGQDFALDSDVVASASSVALSELEAQLGKSRTTGGVTVALKDGVEFDVTLQAARIDVDAMLDAVGTSPQRAPSEPSDIQSGASMAPTPPGGNAKADGASQAFAFPKDVRGTVQVTVDAVTVKGGLFSDVRMTAELADGELALSQLQTMAPGVTDMALFGFVRAKDGIPRFEGDVEVISADPSTFANWLDVKLPDGVAGRVKRVTYKSKIFADTDQVVISGLQITADQSKLTGGVTLALRKRLSFGADLALDTINLDTYMNANGTATNGTGASQPSNATAAPADSKKAAEGPSALEAAQAWVGLSVLNDFDANLKVRVGALTRGGKTFKNVLLDGTLYAGTLDLRSLKLGDYQGGNANLSGTFNGFGAIPEMSKVKLNAKVKDAAALAVSLGASGVPAGLKAVELNVAAEGSLLKPRFDAKLDALKGQFTAKGSFSLLPIGFGYNGAVTAQHGDMVALLNALDIGYKPAGPLGALDLSATVNTDGKTHKITGLKSTLGDTAINGDITARTSGAKPHVTANLQTGALILDRFLPKAQKTASTAVPAPRWTKYLKNPNIVKASFAQDEVAQSTSRADKRWSRDRFDLGALNLLDGELTLKSDAIAFGTYKLSNADIHATVLDGVMRADKIVGNLFGGPLSGSAVVRANGTPTIETDLKLDALQVGQAVQAVTGKDLAAGKLSLNLGFNATGLSPADMVSSLTGGGNLSIDELDVKQGGKGSALSGVIGLVAAMNQLSLGAPKQGKGLADLALAFDIQDGIADAKKMTLNSAMGNGSGSGKVDIAGWGIDFAGNMTVEPNLLTSLLSKGRIGRQEVPFSVRGALDNPGIDLGVGKASTGATGGTQQKLDPFKSLIEKALPGVKLPQQPAPQPSQPVQPTQPQQQDGTLLPPPPQSGSSAPAPTQKPGKPSAEDIIKQLMKGL
ncbi:AsmA family protein [Magnetovibrio sp.]|uniref:AsmA family protein n=1 Tax=Magnetovibrio sp. TaxID=2024836 RepID=UPI002F9219DD